MDRRSTGDQKAPPSTVGGIIRHLGPGLIISGSIVGSGELIMTTRLGAEVGFTLLWLIILSCLIKVFLQVELGRFSIASGETTLEAFDRVPGPRWRVSWLVWCWLAMAICTLIQLSGILYTTADVFLVTKPGEVSSWLALPRPAWVLLLAGSAAALLVSGRYRLVEKGTTIMVFIFTATSMIAGAALQATDSYAVRAGDLVEGLRLGLPQGEKGLLIAVAVFGITGVGASELVWYPYWCLEKGYGRFVGPGAPSREWTDRARGWVRVMQIDAWVSMAVYTSATAAFYFLGAAVLHREGKVPGNDQMLETLSSMYTRSLGPDLGWIVFLAGAFAVLYSTFFVATASNARLLVDMTHVTGLGRLPDDEARARRVKLFCLAIPCFCWAVQACAPRPMTLILVGAIAQFTMLPLIALGTVYLRYRHTDFRLAPRRISDVFLWISFATMFTLGIYQVVAELRKLLDR